MDGNMTRKLHGLASQPHPSSQLLAKVSLIMPCDTRRCVTPTIGSKTQLTFKFLNMTPAVDQGHPRCRITNLRHGVSFSILCNASSPLRL